MIFPIIKYLTLRTLLQLKRFQEYHKFFILIFIFFILTTYQLSSQINEIKFRNPKLPLSDNGIGVIIEDYKGFMWFGSQNGLNKSDGINMVVYNTIVGDSTSLSNNNVLSAWESKNRKLWIGTSNGLNLYNRQLDNFTRFYYSQDPKRISQLNLISKVIEDNDGDIWVATSHEVCLLDTIKKELVTFSDFTNNTRYKEPDFVNTLIETNEGEIIGGSQDGKIFKFDKKTGNITNYNFDNGGLIQPVKYRIRELLLDGNILWAATDISGLLKVEKFEDGHVWYKQYAYDPQNDNSLSYNSVYSFEKLNNNEIILGTSNGGLNIFNFNTENFRRYKRGTNLIFDNIEGNSIWSIYKDSQNRFWLGVFNVGINIIDSIPKKFNTIRNIRSNDNSLTHSSITSFLEDEKGNMWITSDGGGLDYWDRKKNTFTHFKNNLANPNSLSADAAICLHKTKSGEIWIGVYGGGINILQPDKKSFKHLTTKNGLCSDYVFSIAERNNGKIYIATNVGGLNIYDPQTGKMETFVHDPNDNTSLKNNSLSYLFVDSRDNLWISAEHEGINLLKETLEGKIEFEHILHNPNDKNSLSNNSVLAINEDSKGNIWIGTRDGLNRYNPINREFKVYRTIDGLPSNSIVGLCEDDSGKLWISTVNGLSMFNPQTGQFRNYNVDDGLQGEKFNNRSSYYKNSKGELFFGGNHGFSYFHPNKVQYDTTTPNIYFINLKIFNKEMGIATKGSPLKKNITETKKIELSYKQSVFTIEFIAINFAAPQKISYAYKLEGLEENWNYVGNKRTATYTNLDAGEYILKVKSTNIEGDWCNNEKTLKIKILPHWTNTWPFKIVIALVLLVSIFVLYRRKVNAIRKQKLVLEKQVRKRTLQLYETNTQLEEKNEEVLVQREELKVQAENLEDSNKKLRISREELKEHKDKLEELVVLRTKELENALIKAKESDRLKTAFLANMSHEIRTPMNAIIGFSQLLNEEGLTEKDKDLFIKQINSSTSSLLKLIDDLLDISLIESNQIKLKNEYFFIDILLKEVYSNGQIFNHENLELKLNIEKQCKDLQLFTDKDRVKQVLLNLYSNAFKFTHKGFIELGCSLDKNQIVFYIKDSGIGISEENMRIVFDRFRKISDDKTKLFRGVGLGLSISKKIADILDAKLVVESKLNEGSTFSLILSDKYIVKTPTQEKKKTEPGTKPELKNKKILIVEDEEANFNYLEAAIKKTNAEITWAKNGKIALEIFDSGKSFDLVLMDIKMPELNGYETTREIKKKWPMQTIIAQTAYARIEDQENLLKAGFDGYLAKPIKVWNLYNTLSKHIA